MYRTWTLICSIAIALLIGATGAPAASAATLALSPTSGAPGTSVSATGSGFPARKWARLTFGSNDVGTYKTNARGAFSTAFVVPSASSGAVTVTASAAGASASTSFTVLAPVAAPPPPAASDGALWRPGPGTSWQIQLSSPVDQSFDAGFYIIDGFDNSAEVVSGLHAKGRRVGCYISVGSYENWRPDASSFPAAVLGNSNGWPGEKWLDIRRLDVLAPIIDARLDMCRAKGFDAVDPDNVDGYANNTGFPLTAADQLAFNRYVAAAAHSRGMSVGLKNDLDQVATLEPAFDFAVNEQCFEYSECASLTPFVAAGKPVFNIEYRGELATFCPDALRLGLSSQKKKLALDAWREVC